MILPYYTVSAKNDSTIYFSEDFSSYPENVQTLSNISAQLGIDTRVITDDGSKVLFSRAFGESAKIKAIISAEDSEAAVMSARIKITGSRTSGKFFSVENGNNKYDFLTLSKDGKMVLSDGKNVGGFPLDKYITVTVAADWANGMFNIYIGGKCVAQDWKMPSSVSGLPTGISWGIDYTDNKESDLYIDDIRVYEGDELPEKVTFPAETASSEVIDFTPTEKIDDSVKILQDIEFNDSLSGAYVSKRSGGVKAETDAEGNKYARLYADKKTEGGTYFDINDASLAKYPKYIVDIRFKVNQLKGSAAMGMFDSKDSAGTWRLGYAAYPDGVVKSRADGSNTGTYSNKRWVRYSFAYDITSGKTDIYRDGKYVKTDTIPDGFFPTIFRIDLYNSVGSIHDTEIDWIRIYSGTELKDDAFFADSGKASETAFKTSRMDPADKLKSALDGKTVFMMTNDTAYIGGKKQSYADDAAKPYVDDKGIFMVPQNMFSAAGLCTVTVDALSGNISFGSNAQMKTGETAYMNGSVKGELTAAPAAENGTVYLPLRSVTEQILNKKVTWDPRGMIIIGNEKMQIDDVHYLDRYMQWKPADLIYRYMQFDNPGGAKMLEDLKKNHPDNEHPRVLYTKSDINYILDNIETDSEFKGYYESLINSADGIVAMDYTEKLKVTTETKQATVAEMQSVMETIATAYLLTGDIKYAEKGTEILMSLCSWDNLDYDYANLICGHWGSIVGIGYDSFYNYLMSSDEGKKKAEYIRNAALKLAMQPHIEAYGGATQPHWITIQDNFLGVCGGGMMTLVLSMADEKEIQAETEYLLDNIYRSLEIAVGLYYPDGGYYEGVSYLDYMFSGFLPGLNGMFNCFGTDYGLGNAKGFSKAGYMLSYLQSTDKFLNFHDTTPYYNNDAVAEFLGYRYNDPIQAEIIRKQKILGNHSYNLRSYFFYRKATDNDPDTDHDGNIAAAPNDKYFYGAGSGAFQSSHLVANPTFVGFHGGYTGIPHDMLDLGEFVFEADNVMWACDLGRDDYGLPGYFSMTDYIYYRKRPEGENCVVINPAVDPASYYGQKVGSKATLTDLEINKDKGAKAAFDLSDAYSRDASEYTRGYYFGDDRNTLTVQDEIKLRGQSEIYWFMHSEQKIEILSNTKAKLTSTDGKTCIADVYCSASDYTLEAMECKPLPSSPEGTGQSDNAGYTKLAIHAPKASGAVTISVKLSPETGNYTYTPLRVTAIKDWVVPDGERAPVPIITNLSLNGEAVTDFAAGAKSFELSLPFGTTEAPTITAQSSAGNVSIKQPESLTDTAVVTMSGEGIITQEVKISFKVSSDRPINVTDSLSDETPTVGSKGTQIMPKSAAGLTLPEPENTPDKALDNDFSTRATQEGTRLWFEFDLGEVMDISGVSMAFYDGNLRQFNYDIMYSEDGTNFTRVFSGKSTGTTNDYESLAILGKVRYIRYIGNGNTGSAWNSITEFRAYK